MSDTSAAPRGAGLGLGALMAMLLFNPALAQDRPSPPASGRAFQSAETQRLEADEAQNPAYLWVEEGAKLWARPEGRTGKSCESCHGPVESAMKGVAARYPKVQSYPEGLKLLANIEIRINICRVSLQGASQLPFESNELLALTTLVAYQSKGVPRQVQIDGPAAPHFAAGKLLWQTRQGQLDLACTQCHDANAGKLLRGDRISQGHSDGWPAYRLEWQTLGSLHRRLRACSLGVRAEVLDYGAPDYLALELYLAWRGQGLTLSVPGVRR